MTVWNHRNGLMSMCVHSPLRSSPQATHRRLLRWSPAGRHLTDISHTLQPAAGGRRTQCSTGQWHASAKGCQRPKVHPDYALGNSRRGHEGWRSTAGGPGQCIPRFQHLVFFSYSWPCPHALWPPAISQDPVAKTVDGGCCAVQRGSRPRAPLSPHPYPQVSPSVCPQWVKRHSQSHENSSHPANVTSPPWNRSPLKRIKRGTVVPSPRFNESQERGTASPGAVSPHMVTWVLDT